MRKTFRTVIDFALIVLAWPFCICGDILNYFWPMSETEKDKIREQLFGKIKSGDFEVVCHCKDHDTSSIKRHIIADANRPK